MRVLFVLMKQRADDLDGCVQVVGKQHLPPHEFLDLHKSPKTYSGRHMKSKVKHHTLASVSLLEHLRSLAFVAHNLHIILHYETPLK